MIVRKLRGLCGSGISNDPITFVRTVSVTSTLLRCKEYAEALVGLLNLSSTFEKDISSQTAMPSVRFGFGISFGLFACFREILNQVQDDTQGGLSVGFKI